MRVERIAQLTGACLTALLLHVAHTVTASAQAWLPPKGDGSLSLTYSNMYVRNHVSGLGVKNPNGGRIRTNIILSSFEYGLTDSLAINGDLAYVASKWTGPTKEGHGGYDSTGSYHPTFQDAHIELRYNALRRSWVVTPFIGTTIPTHDYETRGHSGIGRGLHEVLLGVNVGGELESILPNTYVHTRYSYAIVERFDGLNLNRSNADCEVGWIANRALGLRFIGTFQRAHGGLTTPLDRVHLPGHEVEFHDRLTRSHHIDLGGGIDVAVTRSFGLHAAYLTNVYARSSHASGGFLAGISWNFSKGLRFGRAFANAPSEKRD
ncbi:MAG TPA: hypothetical protein VFV34_15210 [Blastocatellia bacterium]|nr:hypothetical protein [Blastocatellia bacterium]